MLESRGRDVSIYLFVDSKHAGNVVTRHSHTGIDMFIQHAPIIWLSNKQNTVGVANFGSKLVALRICKDLIVALRYKLRMFGVIFEGPAYVLCDNRRGVKITRITKLLLYKKQNTINYNLFCESVSVYILQIGKEDREINLAHF